MKDDGARALPDNFVQSIIKTRAERYDACEAVLWLAAVCDNLMRRYAEV